METLIFSREKLINLLHKSANYIQILQNDMFSSIIFFQTNLNSRAGFLLFLSPRSGYFSMIKVSMPQPKCVRFCV